MKKLLKLSHSVSNGALLPSLAIALGMVFWSATTAVVNAQTAVNPEQTERDEPKPDKPGKEKPGKGAGVPSGKCDVCHNPHNYHTISIPCDEVDKFLSNHPGDFRGRCQATPVTNP
jgi:hypothetical protein